MYATSSDIATSTSVTEIRVIFGIIVVILAFTTSTCTTVPIIAAGLAAFLDSNQVSASQESVTATYGTIS